MSINKFDKEGLVTNKIVLGGGELSASDNLLIWNGEEIKNSAAPVGSLYWFCGSTVPTGYLICNGSAISRTTYARLFAAIGTKWGTGDGSTTFTLPNLINRVPWGASTAGTYKAAGLPNISATATFASGSAGSQHSGLRSASGAMSVSTNMQYLNHPGGATTSAYGLLSFSASKSNAIYGKSSTVQPPAATLMPIIKY